MCPPPAQLPPYTNSVLNLTRGAVINTAGVQHRVMIWRHLINADKTRPNIYWICASSATATITQGDFCKGVRQKGRICLLNGHDCPKTIICLFPKCTFTFLFPFKWHWAKGLKWICTGLRGRVSEVAFETFREERTQNRLQVSLTP